MASPSTEPTRLTITICGDGGCGKSSITLRVVRSQWTSDYDPTIEDSYTITRVIDGRPYLLSLTDTAGQEEYRGMWAGANMASDAFLLVYDITSAASLDALTHFNDLVEMEADTRQDHNAAVMQSMQNQSMRRNTRGKNTNIQSSRNAGEAEDEIKSLPVKIIAGNKCDLQESRQVDAKTGLEWARARNCGFMETSARNVVNIEETFALIVRRVVAARRVAAQQARQLQDQSQEQARRQMPSAYLEPNAGAYRGLGGNRALPPHGLDFHMGRAEQDQGLGTRRAVTAPLTPLPVAEEKWNGGVRRLDRGDGKRWGFKQSTWRGFLCW